jgi:hypothetical protein
MTSNQLKYCHYTPIRNSSLTSNSSLPFQKDNPDRIKTFKIKIKRNLIYIVEIFYYQEYAFIKFHPKIHESHPNKYQIVGMGLSIEDIKRLLNTSCKIILDEIDKSDDLAIIYAFFGQWYDKDNEKNRTGSKRFSLYRKQVTTFFTLDRFLHAEEEVINFYCISPKQNKQFDLQVKKLKNELADDMSLTELFMTEKAKEDLLGYE